MDVTSAGGCACGRVESDRVLDTPDRVLDTDVPSGAPRAFHLLRGSGGIGSGRLIGCDGGRDHFGRHRDEVAPWNTPSHATAPHVSTLDISAKT